MKAAATKLRIVATHPIQYHVPWFRRLSLQPGVDLRVYYAVLPTPEQQGIGFGRAFEWDIPMLDGYSWELLPNRAKRPALQGFFSSSTPSILQRLIRDRPDVLIITGWQALPLLQAYAAAIALRIPRIMRGDSNSLTFRPRWKRLAHRALLSQTHAFLSVGVANTEFYLNSGVAPRRIFTAPHFVDNERFASQCEQARKARTVLRQRWAIPDSAHCLLYAGKLEPKKRILDLLAAIARARHDDPKIHLLVVGTGALMDAARAAVSEGDLPVSFAGFLNQSEMTDAYAVADCLVLPSDGGETWGLVVNEAMACGVPAIVSDRVGCGPDLIHPGRTGLSFPFGDVDALARSIVEMTSDPARLAAMGVAARDHIKKYSIDAALKGTMDAVAYVRGAHGSRSAGS